MLIGFESVVHTVWNKGRKHFAAIDGSPVTIPIFAYDLAFAISVRAFRLRLTGRVGAILESDRRLRWRLLCP